MRLAASHMRSLPGEGGVNCMVISFVNLIPASDAFKTEAVECNAARLNDFGDIGHFPLLGFWQGEPIPEDHVLT
jgi:hypothetical protein